MRARLREYYVGEGALDPIVIERPKGAYIPSFRQVESAPHEAAVEPVLLPARSRMLPLAVVIAAVLAIMGLVWWAIHRNSTISIAVLPFENLSQDPAQDYIADALSDELIRTLSTFAGMAPRSRTSSFAFKGKRR